MESKKEELPASEVTLVDFDKTDTEKYAQMLEMRQELVEDYFRSIEELSSLDHFPTSRFLFVQVRGETVYTMVYLRDYVGYQISKGFLLRKHKGTEFAKQFIGTVLEYMKNKLEPGECLYYYTIEPLLKYFNTSKYEGERFYETSRYRELPPGISLPLIFFRWVKK